MRPKILKFFFSTILFSVILTGCVNDEFDTPEQGFATYNLTATKTVAEVVTVATQTAMQYTADDIIEAYVTSSDETGNFYNSISLQTIPTDGSNPIGFSVAVDLKSFGEGFNPGRKVYIKLKGLYTAMVDNAMQIGGLYQNEIGRIANSEWNKHLFPSETLVTEDSFVRTLTLAQTATNTNLNTLVEIDNVQFADSSLSRTLYDIDSGGGATNHNIVDVSGGTSRFLRVSSFSLFAVQNVPSGRGKIRGVMTKYGSDYQFIIRSEKDLKLNAPRTYTFLSTLNEGFQSFTNNQRNFTNYLNLNTEGTKNWVVRTGNYLEMSAFGGNYEKTKSYFLIPTDFSAASTLTFQIRAQFYNGSCLKIYRTTNYIPGNKISTATLFDITTSFALPSANTTTFASAGIYNIPSGVTGDGYFVFEYTGTNITTGPAVTTTIQLDNILVN